MKSPRYIFAAAWPFVVGIALYIGSFFLVKKAFIDPYELRGILRTHPIRGVYNSLYYPLRWLNATDLKPQTHNRSIETGFVEKLDLEHLVLSNTSQALYIGFPPSPEFLKRAKGISMGDYVVVELGVQLPKNADRFVNQPLRITKETEPIGAANRSQPIRSETNRPPSAAGSDR